MARLYQSKIGDLRLVEPATIFRGQPLPVVALQLSDLALALIPFVEVAQRGHGNPERLRQQCLDYMAENRAAFEQLAH